jgi:hypothetical protein
MRGEIESVNRGSDSVSKSLVRLGAATSIAALSLFASSSPAAASITIGQLAPGNPPPTTCSASTGVFIQPSVLAGNSYLMPEAGTITSWSHNASLGGGQLLKMKVFRKVADPATYQVVGHDGPRAMVPGGTDGNTFGASIPVKAGDVLGLYNVNGGAVNDACLFSAPGDPYLDAGGDAADGAPQTFSSTIGFRVNVSAELVPTNTFSFGATVRNKKKGTATVTVNVPNPGQLTLSGNGVKAATAARAFAAAAVTAPGSAKLLVKATGKKRKQLNRTGKVKVTPSITFTPTGGDPTTQALHLKLKKRH